MKKLLMLAAAAAAILPMTAQAARPAEGQVTVTTKVEETCAIRFLREGEGNKGSLRQSTTSTNGVATGANASLQFQGGELVNSTTAMVEEVSKVVLLSAFCNFGTHKVSLKSEKGGLTNTSNTGTSVDFNRRIPYTAKITNWNSPTAELAKFTVDGDPTTSSPAPKGAFSDVSSEYHATLANPASLTISTVAGTVPLVKGDYSDVLKIKLGEGF
jgi:hypothetical protein